MNQCTGDDAEPEPTTLSDLDPASIPGPQEDRLRTVMALQRAGLAVVGHLDPDRICSALIAELDSLLPYERSLVAVIDDVSGEIDVLAHAGKDIAESAAERRRIAAMIRDNPHSGVIRWVIENGRALRVDDTARDGRYLVGASTMRSELCVPIMRGNRVLGAINVESEARNAFSRVDELILAAVANPVAVALENAKLYRSLERELVERERAESALVESELRYRALVENAEEGITVVLDGAVEFSNDRGQAILGLTEESLLGRPLGAMTHRSVRRRVIRALEEVLASGESIRLRAIALKGDDRRWVDMAISRIEWGGKPAALCFLSDVTEAQELNRRLGYQASHDDLTGLLNRRAFESRLEKALRSAAKRNVEHVMCYMDLDQFKVINDSCGHQAGDELLAMLSKGLGDAVRERDALARLGGDEFGVLLEHCGIDEALTVAMKIDKVVRDFRMVWDGREYAIGASIGLVALGGAETTVSDVLRAADAACYLAKEEGRGRIRVYREDDATVAYRSTQMQWVARIRDALESDQLQLYCQPIVPVTSTAQGERYEILLRLVDSDRAIITPGDFLPAVERYDLSATVDRHVVETTMRWLGRNPDRLARMELCSINLSARSLGDAELLDAIGAAIRDSGVPARKICFEVTETAAIRDTRASVGFMRSLGQFGCRFALDDFGAGLSSFGYLRELPVEILKIDGSFVSGLPDDATSLSLVSAMQNLARTLGMTTVAEFASSPEIVRALTDIGVDFAQGFAIARPFPLDDLSDS